MIKRVLSVILFLIALSVSVIAQRQIEELNRGLIAVYKGGTNAYLSWRLLAKDDWSIGFNVYRSTAGATAVKLNATPITNSTNYTDTNCDNTKQNEYFVRTVVDGVELETSEKFTMAANTPWRQFFPIPLQATNSTYDVLHVYVGDIDGDGDFDYIVKRFPQDAKYNYILLECYLNDGTFKWRIDLGPNVETYISSMTAPVLVADFNGDGKAEIIAKTGEGTIFGDGTKIDDTDGDNKTDYNSHDGSGTYANVMTGPEFISYINGETGTEIDRNNFIARGKSSDWGDNYGARMNFIMSSICSFDGIKPGIVLSRGPGESMAVEAWDIINNKLSKKWSWSAKGKTFSVGGWTDFHQIQCIDVDADGKDEISWGACMMNPNGTVRYTTELIHGDRFQITDINPNRAGLEAFAIQQNNTTLLASAIYDASTGTMLKKWYTTSKQDIGRGDVADVDPYSPGMELFDLGSNNLHASDGTEAVTGARPYPNVSIWWDADLQREFFVGIGSNGYNPAINKWNVTSQKEERLFTMYNDWGSYSIISPYAGRASFIGDIFGDWREEIALETADHTTLRIYTSNAETSYRIYTLMQNPAYRNAATSKGYLCTKYTDYFLGAGMTTPPKPNIAIIGVSNNAPNVAISSPANGTTYTAPTNIAFTAVASDHDGTISKIEFYQGNTLLGTATTSPYTITWTNATPGTYSITAKATDNNGAVTTSTALTIVVNKPAANTYIYQSTTSDIWTTTADWNPASIPTDYDTAIIRSGEVKIAQNYGGVVKLEPNGIFRITDNISANDLRLQGGTLKSYTSSPVLVLTSTISADKASTIMAGSLSSSIFEIDGTIKGSANITKTGVGLLKLNTSSTNFTGSWKISEGALQVTNSKALGQCGVEIDQTAKLDIQVATSINSIEIKKAGILNLSANLTVQMAIVGGSNLPAGTYTSTNYPAYITGSGSLIVQKSIVQISSTVNGIITLTANTGASYLWSNGASSMTYTPTVSGNYSVKITNNAGCIATSSPISIQFISLTKGWNLMSTNLIVSDSSISTIFNGLDVQEIKTMDAFWRKGQNNMFNSLQKITSVNGYLVNMNSAATIAIAGEVTTFSKVSPLTSNGWQLMGCPFQTATPFSTSFNATNCSKIKNFDGFWIPNGTTNSIQNFEPGKGYFIKVP